MKEAWRGGVAAENFGRRTTATLSSLGTASAPLLKADTSVPSLKALLKAMGQGRVAEYRCV